MSEEIWSSACGKNMSLSKDGEFAEQCMLVQQLIGVAQKILNRRENFFLVPCSKRLVA